MTHLCVSIFVTDLAQARRDVALAAEAGADLVELRIDTFTDPALVRELISTSILPVIATCRAEFEGGASVLPDAERLALLNTAAAASARYVDVELQTLRGGTGELGAQQVIVSSHDHGGRPERLNNILLEMNAGPGSINKVVWLARSIRDNLEAFELLQSRQKPTIAFCMGEAGLISRVLARKFGAFLTFASLDARSATAPGQISIADMKRLYRWDAIGPATKVYGVVASPVAHSMSPAIHNAAFEQVGHDGVYLPLLVQPGYESFKAFLESFLSAPGLDLSGLSVTIPHKENALRYLQQRSADIEPLAQAIGAVNTIVVDPAAPGGLRGMNTDYAAILDTITSALAIQRTDLRGMRVAVIGAGGTGRTAVAALAHFGASVIVYNRTAERAGALAGEFDGKSGKVVAAPTDELCESDCQVYLNTTSVGMHPHVDQSVFGDSPPALGPQTLVFDAVYNPISTKLLRQAEQAGARTASGVEMFVRQAARQFEAWTHQPAPVQLMRQVIEQRLAGR